MPWEEVLDTVKNSGLRGRGGAGFPTWRKWLFCRETPSDERYLICNADEGDPGAFMNRSLIEGDPHALLEGMLIAAYTLGATKGFIYIRAEYPLAIVRLKGAIAEIRALNLLGENILGSDFSFDIKIKEGAGAFVCGEETALMASIEGKTRHAAHPAALSGRFRPVGQTDRHQQRRNAGDAAQYPPQRRGMVQPVRYRDVKRHQDLQPGRQGAAHRSDRSARWARRLRQVIFDIGGGLVKEFKGGPDRRTVGRLPGKGIPGHPDRLRQPGQGRIDHGLGRADRHR